MRLTFSREIIVPTGDFKNQRLRLEASHEFAELVPEDETGIAHARRMLTRAVDQGLSQQIIELKRRLRAKEDRAYTREEGIDAPSSYEEDDLIHW